MDWVVTIAILGAGGFHGLAFSVTLIKIFSLHTNNPLIPVVRSDQDIHQLRYNMIIITFIVMSLVAWVWGDVVSIPLRIYTGAGLLVFAIMFILVIVGKIASLWSDPSP